MSKVKLGFLFLTRDNLNQPKIWEKYFADADPSTYKLYFRPKYPDKVSNKLVKSYLVKDDIKTSWGDAGVVKVEIKMMEQAYRDKCDMFIFLSESHIPFYSYKIIYELLSRYQYNMIDFRKIYKNKVKAEHWMIFNKDAVEYFIKNKNDIDSFNKDKDRKVNMDESYFPTKIYESNIPWYNISTTYVKWKFTSSSEIGLSEYKGFLKQIDSYKKFLGYINKNDQKISEKFMKNMWKKLYDQQNHPILYNSINNEQLNDLKNSYQLFGRKFSSDSNIYKFIDQLWERDTYKYWELNMLTKLYLSNFKIKSLNLKNDISLFIKNYKKYKNNCEYYKEFIFTLSAKFLKGNDQFVEKMDNKYDENSCFYINPCPTVECYKMILLLTKKYNSYKKFMKYINEIENKNINEANIFKMIKHISNNSDKSTTQIVVNTGLTPNSKIYKILKDEDNILAIGNIFNTEIMQKFVKDDNRKYDKLKLHLFTYHVSNVDEIEKRYFILNLYRILLILFIQNIGGYSLLTISGLLKKESYYIIHLLRQLYENVIVYKTVSTNIFDYNWNIICEGFKGDNKKIKDNLLNKLRKYEKSNNNQGRFGVKNVLDVDDIDYSFMNDQFMKNIFLKNLEHIAISNRAYEIVSDIKINEDIYLQISNSYNKYNIISNINNEIEKI